jgi:hypothetical protein
MSWSMFSVRPSSTTRTAPGLRLRGEIICVSHTSLYFIFLFYFIWSAIHGISSPFALSSGIPGRAATTQQSGENNKSRNGRPTLRPMASTMACQRLLAVRDQLRNQQVLSDHGKGKLILRMA